MPSKSKRYENPCQAPDGQYWVFARAPDKKGEEPTISLGGKWLVRMTCPYVEHYWGLIRDAVEEGALGVAAKISTDWGYDQAPDRHQRNHVVCIYTADWRDEADALRAARRLYEIGAVKKMQLLYKPDIFTRGDLYENNAAGELAIYKCKPPYEELMVDTKSRAVAEAMVANARRPAREPKADPKAEAT